MIEDSAKDRLAVSQLPDLTIETVLEAITDAFCALDRDYRIVHLNHVAASMMGLPVEDVVGKNHYDLFPILRDTDVERNYAECMASGEACHFEFNIPGTSAWLEIHAYPQADGLSIFFRNVTEQKEAQRIIAESHERERARNQELEALLSAVPAVILWAHDADAKTITGNRAAYELLKLPEGTNFSPLAYEGQTTPFRAYSHGKPVPPDQMPVVKASRGEAVSKVELEIVTADGESKSLYGSAVPLSDEHGNARGGIAAYVDLTEFNEVLKRLDEERATLSTLNEVGQRIASELDLHTLVQAATDACTQLSKAEFGAFFYNAIDESGESYMLYTISGVPREHFSKFPMPRNTDVFRPTFEGKGTVRVGDITKDPRYGKNEPYHGMPQGHLPVTSYLAVPVISRSGEVHGGLFFGHSEADVFDRRAEIICEGIAAQAASAIDNARLYGALQESDERFRVALANGLVTVYQQDLELRYQWIYPYAPEFSEGMVGRRDEDTLPPDEAQILGAIKRRVIETGKSERHEISASLPTGQKFYDLVVEPAKDKNGNVIGVRGTAADITLQHQAEAEIRRLNAELENKVRERTARLESLVREMEGFTYSISHDLRTPIRGLISNIRMILEDHADQLDDEGRKSLFLVEAEAKRMAALVNDLLEYARLSRTEVEKVPLDLASVASEVIAQITHGEESSVKWLVSDSLPATGDAAQLKLVLLNLLENAVKYRNAHELVVELGVRDGAFYVRDNGIGFDQQYAEKVFRPFERLHRANEYAGSGIGLANVKRIIERHGGQVWVEAVPGEGATFYFTLPE